MEELMLKIDNVSKEYRLGQIGGTTLRDELQRFSAKVQGKEDPTKRIGAKNYNKGDKFLALDGVSFDVKKGERVGIIGHNGAGKSTLLKLISRVTAPSSGTIYMNGRVASMLEVGTGFHPELTGRENIYMNGAILGMTKKEIDAKMEDIIEFSECRQFIDTPVKRYSSGMYVKLAFSVAAHLDSEIMIMDEVLAVGDASFQKKCLSKMRQVSEKTGRTILYVSHNMNTIRQLCDRVIVLCNGCAIFDGDVEKGIEIYLGNTIIAHAHNDFSVREYDPYISAKVKILSLDVLEQDNIIKFGSAFRFQMSYEIYEIIENLNFRFTILSPDRSAVATTTTSAGQYAVLGAKNTVSFTLDTSRLAPSDYIMQIVAFEPDNIGFQIRHDFVPLAVSFKIHNNDQLHNFVWDTRAWGNQVLSIEEGLL